MQSSVTSPCTRNFGFTLLELIITLSVVMILFSIAIPAFRTLTVKNLQTSELNKMAHHLLLARSLSISKQTHHLLCPSRDGESCGHPTDWNHGHILFEDTNKNRSRDPNESLEAVHKPSHDESLNIETTRNYRYIVYRGDGRPSGYNLILKFCDPESRIPPKGVYVSNKGRIRVSDTNWDGTPLICSG